MNCTEVRALQDAYLDSELDTKTTLEVQQHLKSCAECDRLFAEAQSQNAQIAAGLNWGGQTKALWEEIEQSVSAVAVAEPRAQSTQKRRAQQLPLTAALSPPEGEGVPFMAGEGGSLSLHGFSASQGLRFLSGLCGRLQTGWRRSRWVWSGLGVAWVVILVLDFTAREPGTNTVAQQGAPSASDLRLARQQKQQIMAELNLTTESASADAVKPISPSPRSDRRKETWNT